MMVKERSYSDILQEGKDSPVNIARLYGSIRAYLNGEQTLNWILGIIEDSKVSKDEIKEALDSFRSSHGSTNRFERLEKEL